MKACATPAATPSVEIKRPVFHTRKSVWPETKESYVMIISDDEDGDEEQ